MMSDDNIGGVGEPSFNPLGNVGPSAMSGASAGGGGPSAMPTAKFDPSAAHQQRPKLRPVRGFPAQVGDQVMLGLADARQISDKMVVAPPAVQHVLPLLDGLKSLPEIVTQVGQGLTEPVLESIVAQLDDAGLLFGPKFDQILLKMRAEFDSSETLPPAASAAFAGAVVGQKLGRQPTEQEVAELGPRHLREVFEEWITKALEKEAKPTFDELPVAVMVPHVDYPRGWLNYASVWGRMRVADRPDRVVILGTNHFGMGTGVTACNKGYETLLGSCPLDTEMLAEVQRQLGPEQGEKLIANRYDHEREHSIELQIPWIQHCIGPDEQGRHVPVFAALVHDPAVNNGQSYDGAGVALEPFVEAVRAAKEKLGGRTLVVSSADLSHAGPMFGDQHGMAGQDEQSDGARRKVMQHDQEMLEHVRKVKPDDLVAAMAWQQNPTRWCSTGNIVAALMITRPERVDLLRYMAAIDEQGMGMVSSAAAAMY
ncbi:MAG: AmmeMemoRadiSam system protein B [Phycisphaerales bacterium]